MYGLGYAMGYQIIGSHFFEHTINGTIYLAFLQNHLPIYFMDIPWMSARGFDFNRMMLQYIIQDVRICLDEQYPNHWIRGEDQSYGLRDHRISILLITICGDM